MAAACAYPSKDLLRAKYVGKNLFQVATPSIVLDLAKLEANCNLMLEAAQRLDLSWRAHIKTHKVRKVLSRHYATRPASTSIHQSQAAFSNVVLKKETTPVTSGTRPVWPIIANSKSRPLNLHACK